MSEKATGDAPPPFSSHPTAGERTAIAGEKATGDSKGQGSSNLTAVIKNVDMSEEMQTVAVDMAVEAMQQMSLEKDMAAHIKRSFDLKYGPTWHAVVGRNYGSYVTHETKHFIYFYLGTMAFLIWRA